MPSVSLAGHEDWVKALDFRNSDVVGDALVLASGSQDTTIRLWNIEPHEKPQKTGNQKNGHALSDDLLDAFEESLGDLEADEGGRQISLKRHVITVKDESGKCDYPTLLIKQFTNITLAIGPLASSSLQLPSTLCWWDMRQA